MAWTDDKMVTAEALQVRLLKGNGLQDIITEEHINSAFQATLAAGMDVDKAIFCNRQVAALGARDDELWLRVPYNNDTTGIADVTPIKNKVFAQITDYSGVPVAVQHAVFGKYSPFVTPSQPVNDSMLDGIDIQELGISDNVVQAVDAAMVENSMKLHGSANAKIKAGYYDGDDANVADPTGGANYYAIRLLPAADEVFVLKRGAVLWQMPDATDDDAFGEST